jgi:hypothetical protein
VDTDRELLIRLDERIARLSSDIESEKGTRARVNAELNSRLGQLAERIDTKCDALAEQIRAAPSRQERRISWLERMAWIAMGGIGFVMWLLK